MKPLHKLPVALIFSLVIVGVSGCQRDTSQGELPKSGAADQSSQSSPPTARSDQSMGQQAKDAASAAGDAAITAKVKAALLMAPELKSAQISVDTASGIVTLSGDIDTAQNVERATQAAQSVDGVKSVSNQLKVKQQG